MAKATAEVLTSTAPKAATATVETVPCAEAESPLDTPHIKSATYDEFSLRSAYKHAVVYDATSTKVKELLASGELFRTSAVVDAIRSIYRTHEGHAL